MEKMKLEGRAKSRGKINAVTLSGYGSGPSKIRRLNLRDEKSSANMELVLMEDQRSFIVVQQAGQVALHWLDDNALLAIREHIEAHFQRKQEWLSQQNVEAIKRIG
jgi:hypothetical protein